jgi:uncharacterized tellurite resistance protein B-like protein
MSLNLFVGLKGRGADNSLDLQTAVMIPMVAAMLADNRLDDEEFAHIEGICTFSPIYDRNSATENGALIMRAIKLVEDHGIAAMCQNAAAVLPAPLRETAFVFAVRVIFSDGYVGRLEQDVIEKMIEWLSIPPGRARDMIEVVSIMNHPISVQE